MSKMPPADKIAQYDALIATIPELERKGKTTPYTSCNGHMFSFLSKEGSLALRLGKDQIAAFLTEHNATLMEQHGRTMKDFVQVPDALFADLDRIQPYLAMSYTHTASLKPKPTKKKK